MTLLRGSAAARQLVAPGVLGVFSHMEVTELMAFVDGKPINVFTILVAEARTGKPAPSPAFLNKTRIGVPGLKGWRFGIWRYLLPLNDALAALERLEQFGRWDASGNALELGPLIERPIQFVPSNQGQSVPLNAALKNNFWAGSHVIEWVDQEKTRLTRFFDDPRLLQRLSEAVGVWLPVRLAGLTDRLGNLIVQVPVTAVMASFTRTPEGFFNIDVAWHPDVLPRPLRATVDVEFDGTITGHFNQDVEEGPNALATLVSEGTFRAHLWDSESKLVVAASGPGHFIRAINLGSQMVLPEPRTFQTKTGDGTWSEQRALVGSSTRSLVRGLPSEQANDWTRKRMYREETVRLAEERRFVQYRPAHGSAGDQHQKALDDIRHLIARYGAEGAWLWDPYLTAEDLLNTLFFCPHTGVDLRGLTALKQPPKEDSQGLANNRYRMLQRQTLEHAHGNRHGLRLAYRAKSGMAGWAFHDRFLIFPRANEGALAWSLGTSLNALGKGHHILQRVDDGQQVSDAFIDLWDCLQAPDHLIWETGTP